MLSVKRLAMVAALSLPVVGLAQDALLPYNSLKEVGENSVAPTRYGWKLANTDIISEVVIDGEAHAFQLSEFFPEGVALGATAAGWSYRPNGAVRTPGPDFRIYPAGMLAVLGKAQQPVAPEALDGLRSNPLSTVQGTPDLFLPRLGQTAPLMGGEACPDDDAIRGVYFYASNQDPADDGPMRVMITWYQMLPEGDCDAKPNTFQMIVQAQPPGENDVRPPARVEYRYGECGWSVPNQDALPDAPDLEVVSGARSGLLFNSAAPIDVQRAAEVLGPKEQVLGVDAGGLLNPGLLRGASGHPQLFQEFCSHSNRPNAQANELLGQFAFDLTTQGLMLKDADGDGVVDSYDGGPDNCEIANPYQSDFDNDGAGDACDPDTDEDLIPNAVDLCDFTDSQNNNDLDNDGLGDVCDSDMDGDEIPNWVDNCRAIPNVDQYDFDADGLGLRCDAQEEMLIATAIAVLKNIWQQGWTIGPPQLEVIEDAPDETKIDWSTSSFVQVWMTETGKSEAEIWARVSDLLSWKLDDDAAASLRAAAEAAYDTSGDDRVWFFYSWSKTGDPLGYFLEKHGDALLKDY